MIQVYKNESGNLCDNNNEKIYDDLKNDLNSPSINSHRALVVA